MVDKNEYKKDYILKEIEELYECGELTKEDYEYIINPYGK